MAFLPYGKQNIEDDDIEAVVAALRSDWLTCGPLVDEFENNLAREVGAKGIIALTNGTAALHLACMAAGLGPGDVAVVPAITFLATANAASFCGAEIVFADVDPDTALMRVEDVAKALKGRNPKVILPVHMAGQMADVEEIAKAYPDAIIIEDACHALGSSLKGRKAGSCTYSQMACFSFHPVKTIAMGEGGAIATNDPAIAAQIKRLRHHGMQRDAKFFTNKELAFAKDGSANPWYYEMPSPGYNYRISDINCALGISQLKKLPRFATERKRIVALYDKHLPSEIKSLKRIPESDPVWHLFVALIDFAQFGKDRARVMNELKAQGIGSQVHYMPIPLQPYYRELCGPVEIPGAMEYYRRALSLPLFPGMGETEVGRVVQALELLLNGR